MGFFKIGSANVVNTTTGKRLSPHQIGTTFGYGKIFVVTRGKSYKIQVNCNYKGDLCVHIDGSKYTISQDLTVIANGSKMCISLQIQEAKGDDYIMMTNINIQEHPIMKNKNPMGVQAPIAQAPIVQAPVYSVSCPKDSISTPLVAQRINQLGLSGVATTQSGPVDTTGKLNILYLVNRDIFINKVSRVRFHAINKLGALENVIYSGNGWDNYDNSKTVQQNVDSLRIKIDFIICYKPGELLEFNKVRIPKCIQYNEMWDIPLTLAEINLSNPDLIVCHHQNDIPKYPMKSISYMSRFVHIPHCAEKSIFYDYNIEKDIDIMLSGAMSPKHYPFRNKLQQVIGIMPKKYKCIVYKHPGTKQGDAHSDVYQKEYAKVINRTKICVTCTSAYKYRLGKMVEIAMCGSLLGCDMPGQDHDEFNEFMIVLNPDDSLEQLRDQLVSILENPIKMKDLKEKTLKWASKYTQEYYAEELQKTIYDTIEKYNKNKKIFLIGDEMTSKEKWICDIFKEEFIKYSGLNVVNNSNDADIIWLLAPWKHYIINPTDLKNKYVITTIHHIDWDKYSEFQNYYKLIDDITNIYHVICPKTYESLKKITTKKIIIKNFWINAKNYFNMDNKLIHKMMLGIPTDKYIIGSFQKDTEGKDMSIPKLSKGPDIFVNIVADMNRTKPVHVVLTGWRRTYIINELNKLGISYSYFELVNMKMLNALYNALDLYIVSSRIEGGPRAILEAGLTKTPIISTDVGISDSILAKESIYNKDDYVSYKNAVPNIEVAYENVKKYIIDPYMDEFINDVFKSSTNICKITNK